MGHEQYASLPKDPKDILYKMKKLLDNIHMRDYHKLAEKRIDEGAVKARTFKNYPELEAVRATEPIIFGKFKVRALLKLADKFNGETRRCYENGKRTGRKTGLLYKMETMTGEELQTVIAEFK